KSTFAVAFTANCAPALSPTGSTVIDVSTLLLRMTAVDDRLGSLPAPGITGTPAGAVKVAGFSTPKITPSVSQSPQLWSAPTAANALADVVNPIGICSYAGRPDCECRMNARSR